MAARALHYWAGTALRSNLGGPREHEGLFFKLCWGPPLRALKSKSLEQWFSTRNDLGCLLPRDIQPCSEAFLSAGRGAAGT